MYLGGPIEQCGIYRAVQNYLPVIIEKMVAITITAPRPTPAIIHRAHLCMAG
jgi:hypothetical protein